MEHADWIAAYVIIPSACISFSLIMPLLLFAVSKLSPYSIAWLIGFVPRLLAIGRFTSTVSVDAWGSGGQLDAIDS